MTTHEIIELIDSGNIVKFYQSREWRELREDVMRDYSYECQRCMERGRYTRATMVHHVQELRKRPELALSKTYVDLKGVEHQQLMPLCQACHEAEHNKLGTFIEERTKHKFRNKERW